MVDSLLWVSWFLKIQMMDLDYVEPDTMHELLHLFFLLQPDGVLFFQALLSELKLSPRWIGSSAVNPDIANLE